MKIETGRNNSFLKVISILEEEYNDPITIVETGCIRNVTEESKFGDGWSTLNWEYYCKKSNSIVYVVDINEGHLSQSKKIVPPSEHVKYFLDDSVHYLQEFDKKIDLLFLDAWDVHNGSPYAEKHYEAYLIAKEKLSDKHIISIDDTDIANGGKGKILIPYLLNNGYNIIVKGRQTIMTNFNIGER